MNQFNFYGVMVDDLNEADRVEAVRHLLDAQVVQRLGDTAPVTPTMDFPYLLLDQIRPVLTTVPLAQSQFYVQIPRNLRQHTIESLLEWRIALRTALSTSFADDYSTRDFSDNAYLLKRI